MHTNTQTHTHMQVYMYAHTHTNIYRYACMHTHTHSALKYRGWLTFRNFRVGHKSLITLLAHTQHHTYNQFVRLSVLKGPGHKNVATVPHKHSYSRNKSFQ